MGGKASVLILLVAATVVTGCKSKAQRQHEEQQHAVDSMAALRAAGKTDLSNPEMGAKVLIRIFEDSIFQSHREIPKGQVTFAVENKGTKTHDFKVNGPAGSWTSTPISASGYVLMSIIIDKPGGYDLTSPMAGGPKVGRTLTVK